MPDLTRFVRHKQYPSVPEGARYTTLDEIDYLCSLKQKGRLDLLRNTLHLAPYRIWYGPGMEVDPIQVIEKLRELIAEMELELMRDPGRRENRQQRAASVDPKLRL